jgi:single-stranded-DNA-specific exonuclease
MQKRWNIIEPAPRDFVAGCRVSETPCGRLHDAILHLLWQRGIRTPDEISAFLEPAYERDVHDPFLFSQMERAVGRIFRAIENGERILVFGDYDADGVTSSTIVISTIREIAARMGVTSNVTSYIPHRDREGYGLIMAQAERFAGEGHQLIITVDCGISCPNEFAFLKSRGIDAVVVDHHQFGDVLPDAILIHPAIPGETYPFKQLAAAGVAWKLACALAITARRRGIDLPDGFEKWMLDLVAIATVADVVPLVGENRTLLAYGLRVLRKTRRPGLLALLASAGIPPNDIGSRDIGFAIAPRLNAPSRMAHAELSLALLLAPSPEEAEPLAREIERLNRARQQTTVGMMARADGIIAEREGNARIHVLWDAGWSPALVGLVAGRIADRFGVPVIAIGKHEDAWIGSGRSLPAYDITEAVRRAGDGLLTRSGGHVQACGFSLASDEFVQQFADRLRADAEEHLGADAVGPAQDIHAEIGLGDVDWVLVESLERIDPFGQGNPEPIFMSRGLDVASASVVGKDGTHLRLFCRSADGSARPFIGFGFAPRASEASRGSKIDIAYSVAAEERNGVRDIRCKIVDLRPHTLE